MLDMGFLPDIRRVLRHLPTKRQTLFFSATMPPPIAELSREMLHNPATINLERRSAPAVGITQAVYPVPQQLKAPLLVELLTSATMHDALVFTRTKHRANRLAQHLDGARHQASSAIHGNRSQAQRTEALAGFKSGQVSACSSPPTSPRAASTSRRSATSSTSTCRRVPEDYIHRVGRTARAELTGAAFTFVSPEEEGDLRGIERAIGKRAAARDAARFRLQRARRQRLRTAASGSAVRRSTRTAVARAARARSVSTPITSRSAKASRYKGFGARGV